MHVRFVRSNQMAFRYKDCVYMCLIDLLKVNYKQHGLIAINQMPKLNLEQPSISLGIFVAVLSQSMVSTRDN